MAGESSKVERTKTILLFEEKTSSRFNWSVFELIQYCVFFSERFSSQRMRSLGDSGEILVVHLKKLFRRPRSASRLLFTLCPIPFFLLWLVPSFTEETLQWFSAPWSSIWSYTLSARGTFPQGNLQHATLDLSPKTSHKEQGCTCSSSQASTLLLIKTA